MVYQELLHFVTNNTTEVVCRNWANDIRKLEDCEAELNRKMYRKQAEVLESIIMEHETQGIVNWSLRLHQIKDDLLQRAKDEQ